MSEIAHIPKTGPLVEVSLIRWTRPLPYDEADCLVKSLLDEAGLLPSAQIHDLKEEVDALENELADEKERWRKRLTNVVALARRMIVQAKPAANATSIDDAFRW